MLTFMLFKIFLRQVHKTVKKKSRILRICGVKTEDQRVRDPSGVTKFIRGPSVIHTSMRNKQVELNTEPTVYTLSELRDVLPWD